MQIMGENQKGYVVRCSCGVQHVDDGADDEALCPSCGRSESIDLLVQSWWSKAGWVVPTPLPISQPQPERRSARA